jgi:hypothetical protein
MGRGVSSSPSIVVYEWIPAEFECCTTQWISTHGNPLREESSMAESIIPHQLDGLFDMANDRIAMHSPELRLQLSIGRSM